MLFKQALKISNINLNHLIKLLKYVFVVRNKKKKKMFHVYFIDVSSMFHVWKTFVFF